MKSPEREKTMERGGEDKSGGRKGGREGGRKGEGVRERV